ncbi:MAG TPA: hypothetical protein VKB10_03430 [Gaiellaceae bacterium]|nr:hypothetical protein [Gaiellaceae bacterium]
MLWRLLVVVVIVGTAGIAGRVGATTATVSGSPSGATAAVTITAKPPLLTNQGSATFSFSTEKSDSGFECKLDAAAFTSCASPQLYGALQDGAHTFAVRTISPKRKVGTASAYTWAVDTTAPHTTIVAGPPARSRSASASFTFASNEPGATFGCRLDAAGFSPCTSPQTYTGIADGAHAFRVQALDAAGNADPAGAAFKWAISGGGGAGDHTPPGDVTQLRRSVGYRRLQLRWKAPVDVDFDHVDVYVSTTARSPARTLVYRGRRASYADKRFRNGLHYRYLVVSYDFANNPSRGKATALRPSVLLKAPSDRRTVYLPPLLRWTAVPNATYYNVQVFHLGHKVLSAWPRKPRQALTRTWRYRGRAFTLTKGTYAWFVWPGFGPRSRSDYGQLLGQASFRMAARPGR